MDLTKTLVGGSALLFAAWVVYGLVLIIFPIVVMLQLSWLNSKLEKTMKDQKDQADHAEKTANLLVEEMKNQTALTRQLLRAYGHEPES